MTDPTDSLKARRAQALALRAAGARAGSAAIAVGVTGSSGKSTTTALLAHILAAHGRVRPMVRFNNVAAIHTFQAREAGNYDFIVAELSAGIFDPVPLKAQALRPDIAIVTMIALEHKSQFGGIDAIATEKAGLIAALRPGGLAVLNGDDVRVAAMAVPAGARSVRFGRGEGNDYRAIDPTAAFPRRLSLSVAWRRGVLPLQTQFVGEHFWLPATAAVATALELGVPPETVAERVATFEPLADRCSVFSIPGGPHFILDTAKAPWHSLKLAFDVLAPVVAPRKRIVLGHISDYYGSNKKYRVAYRMAREVADEVIFVGDHAHRAKAPQDDIAEGRFHAFAAPEQAAAYVRQSAIADEVILIKSSTGLHLERIAFACRQQVHCWVPSCRLLFGCLICGRYAGDYGKRPWAWPTQETNSV